MQIASRTKNVKKGWIGEGCWSTERTREGRGKERMKEIVYQGVRRGKEVGGGKIYAGQATTHAEKEEEK